MPMISGRSDYNFSPLHVTEQEAKELLDTLWVKQILTYDQKGKYETDLKNLETKDSNMAEYTRKNLENYKIEISLDQEKLTTKLLAKNGSLKSFVQIIEPQKINYADITVSKYLTCESSKPSKKIESPEFAEEPKCPSDTLLVEKNW